MYDKTRNNTENAEVATNETTSHADVESVAFTKREAILLLHSREHFPRGFDPEDLAISLGWSIDEVHEVLLACTALGLVKAPSGAEAPPLCAESRVVSPHCRAPACAVGSSPAVLARARRRHRGRECSRDGRLLRS